MYVPEKLRNLAADALYGCDDIEYVIVNIASPFFDDFFKDKAPDDVSATFPGYGRNEAKLASFSAEFKQFFNIVFLAFNAVISLIFR